MGLVRIPNDQHIGLVLHCQDPSPVGLIMTSPDTGHWDDEGRKGSHPQMALTISASEARRYQEMLGQFFSGS